MAKIPVSLRALLFALTVALLIPTTLWLVVQAYDWTCTHWVSCEGKKNLRIDSK